MHLRVFSAENFRNLNSVLFEPHPRFNVLHGDNGQGKTNILEAIYLLATLRSFRTSRSGEVEELVQSGQQSATVRARVEREQVERLLQVELHLDRPLRKQALVDGKAARATEYFGGVNAVLFAPEDLRLPKGSPSQRRRFVDRAVWNTCPAYLKEVQTYERILRSRNALLRQSRSTSIEELLPVYDEQLARAGAVLIVRRRAYLHSLAGPVKAAFERVSRTGLEVTVSYRCTTPADALAAEVVFSEAILARHEQALSARIQGDRRRDLQKGYTHSGPHADDLAFELSGHPASQYASQGQLRMLVLALKIAEIQHLRLALGDAPVLLLDDVSSELDATRNAQLFDFLREVPCQTFITTTSAAHIQLNEERKDFRVAAGGLDLSSEGVL